MSETIHPAERGSTPGVARPRAGPRPSTRVPRRTADSTGPRISARATGAGAPGDAFRLARTTVATVTVGPDESPEHLFRRLLGAYLAGAREFVVIDRAPPRGGTREIVRTFCRRTRQPEIVSEEAGVLRLRDLAYDSPVSVAERLTRMGRMVVAFQREAVGSWTRLPLGDDSYWERRDDEVDREAWYVQRLASLGLESEGTRGDLLGAWTVARSLERIADHAIVLGEVGRRLGDLPDGTGPLASLRPFHRQAMVHLEGVLAARDGTAANDLLDMGDALLASGRALSERLLPAVGGGTMPPATAAAVSRILESIGRTVAYAQDIAQVALDRAVPTGLTDRAGPDAAPIPG